MKRISILLLFFTLLTSNRQALPYLPGTLTENKLSEKVYLHFDKPNYGANDQIWFKAYVTDAVTHRPSDLSKTLYVELIDSNKEIIDDRLLEITDGAAAGDFKLTKDIKPGSYRIRAYTNWMRNFGEEYFFRREFSVVNPNQAADTVQNATSEPSLTFLDFLPEGGDLVSGIPSKIAVKAADQNGKPIEVSGKILDNTGKNVANFSTDFVGNALTFLVPSKDQQYIAEVNNERFELPRVKEKGATMRVVHNEEAEAIRVSVLSTGIDLSEGSLIAHQRGTILFSQLCSQPNNFAFAFSKKGLKPGIIHLTFFDKNQVPLTERLIFPIIPEPTNAIQIDLEKESYNRREKVNINLSSFVDSLHSASITINPSTEVKRGPFEENIVNYLLLSSDLVGKIHSPNHYFQGGEKGYDAMDLLMLTQGWTRFKWEEILQTTENVTEYLPEKGVTVAGKLVDFYDPTRPREGIITMSVPELGAFDISGRTSANGTFRIGDNLFRDSTRVVLKATGFRGRKEKTDENVTIVKEETVPPAISPIPAIETEISEAFVSKVDKLIQISNAYNLDPEAIMLDELVVTARRIEAERRQKQSARYGEPSNRLDLDSLNYSIAGQSVFDLLRNIPGVIVSGPRPNQSVIIRGVSSIQGATEPLYILDGAPVDNLTIQSIPVQLIDFIDVLKGPKASSFGIRGANGVVLVYTKSGNDFKRTQKVKGTLVFTHPGYYKAKEFYSPDYSSPKDIHKVPDYRSTLYWNPHINFTGGEANLTFYSSDQKGTFDMIIEGITKNGTPIRSTGSFNVK